VTNTWLAIETTDEGEVLHGVSHDLAELQKRVNDYLIKAVIEAEADDDEIDGIAESIKRLATLHVHPGAITRAAMNDVIGERRTVAIFETICVRLARIAYSRG